MTDNLVSQPPLITPIVDDGGRLSKAWSIWFRDLYRRVAFKGGNSIDDNLNLIDETIDTLEEAIVQILLNAQGISNNADGIEQNAENITTNAEGILINAANTLFLEHLALGEDRPEPYDDTATSYLQNDMVVFGLTDPQNYYLARQDISAPAGVFDPTKWNLKSIRDSLTVSAFLEVAPIKAVHFAFQGTAANGAVTPAHSFNIDTLERTGIGVYEGTIKQDTFYGFNILDNVNPLVSYQIAPTVDTEAFHIEFVTTGGSGFTINVFEWVQGTGNKIDLEPYDPIGVNDMIFVTALTDLSNGVLPPP